MNRIPSEKIHKKYAGITIICLMIYLFINSLFVYKYGSRQHHINPVVLTISFLFFYIIVFGFFISKKLNDNFYKYSFFIIAGVYVAACIIINNHVNGYTLVPDRWSAMQAGIKSLFSGQYPYSALDHRNGRSSNLPTLIFIGIPFYFLGSVSYLQVFSAALFFGLIFYLFKENRKRFFAALLFVLSVSFIYEEWVKSDVMSNFIIVAAYVVFMQKKKEEKKEPNIYLTAIVAAQLLLTRVSAIIPLIIILFQKFLKWKTAQKIYFLLISILVTAVNFWIVFHNVSSYEEFKEHNPFELQSSQLPFALSVLSVLLSIMFSYFSRNMKTVLKYCFTGLFIPALFAMFWHISKYGAYKAFFDSHIDLSYWNMSMPFLVLYWAASIR